MVDSNALKSIFIFEAGTRLSCGAEIECLAAHLYFRFFRCRHEITQYDIYIFACASIKLAHMYYEKPLDMNQLALVLNCIQNGPRKGMSGLDKKKLIHSIEVAARIALVNLDFQINYSDIKIMTPGELNARRQSQQAAPKLPVAPVDVHMDEDDYSEDPDEVDMDAKLLTHNNRYQISPQRYLVHYLNTLHMWLGDDAIEDFKKLCNISWAFLADAHWVPRITKVEVNITACVCLMMAIEMILPEYSGPKVSPKRRDFAMRLNRKWNLIFCDDLDDEKFKRLRNLILRDYNDYDRLLEHQFTTFAIDPRTSERRTHQSFSL